MEAPTDDSRSLGPIEGFIYVTALTVIGLVLVVALGYAVYAVGR